MSEARLEAIEARSLTVQRRVVLVLVVLSAVVLSRELYDTFHLIKAFIIAWGAVALILLGVSRNVLAARIVIPQTWVIYAEGVFLLGLVYATLLSDRPMLSLVGDYQRQTGAIEYGAYAIVMFATARAFTADQVHRIASAIGVAATLVAGYALLQWIGADPVQWGGGFADELVATLGNPNFLSGYLGIVLPVLGYLVLSSRLSMPWRRAAALIVLLSFAATWETASTQGIVAGVAGVGFLALAWVLEQGGTLRRRGLIVLGGGALAGLGILAAGLLDVGLPGRLIGGGTLALRRFYWGAAAAMGLENPLTGVGMDRYGAFFRSYRSVESAQTMDLVTGADNPHNVLLSMFASGGVPLALAYVAVVLATAWLIIRGLRQLTGDRRLLLGGLSGGWAGYQFVSMVSIDVPGIAFLHWLLTGAIVALVGAESRIIPLPWPPVHEWGGKRSGRRARSAQKWALAAVAVVALVALWPLSFQLRAEAAHSNSRQARMDGQFDIALAESQRSVELAPWVPEYWFELGQAFLQTGRRDAAADAYARGLDADPGDLFAALAVARVARQDNNTEAARRYYETTLEIEPQHPQLVVEAAEFYLEIEAPDRALPLARAAVDTAPEDPRWWFVLGRTHADLGDASEARAALEQARSLTDDEQLIGHIEERLAQLDDDAA